MMMMLTMMVLLMRMRTRAEIRLIKIMAMMMVMVIMMVMTNSQLLRPGSTGVHENLCFYDCHLTFAAALYLDTALLLLLHCTAFGMPDQPGTHTAPDQPGAERPG